MEPQGIPYSLLIFMLALVLGVMTFIGVIVALVFSVAMP